MNKHLLFIAIFLGIVTSCSDEVLDTDSDAHTSPSAMLCGTDYVAGELLLKAAGTTLPEAAIEAVVGTFVATPAFPSGTTETGSTSSQNLSRWHRLQFSADVNVPDALTRLSVVDGIEKVQVNRITRIQTSRFKPVVVSDDAIASRSASAESRVGGSSFFSDPLLFRQWGYANRGGQSFARDEAPSIAGCDLNCEEAWALCTGDPSIIVAVLDEGVMYSHPDLADNMWVNEGEELHAGRDADGNGYVDDKYGYNFVTDCAIINPYSRNNTGHGSHVAGTISAVNNNGIGCCGIAGGDGTGNGVKIMSCQIIDGNNAVTLLNEARAMKYAADNGAVVLQCSWGYNSSLADQLMGWTPGPATEEEWETLYPLEKEAIDYFIDTAGSADGVIDGGIVVFAGGNEAAARPAFPAAYHRCVCVGSIAADYTPSTFSNYGSEVDFSAPGGDSDYYGIPGVDDDEYDITDPLDERGMILSTLVVDDQPAYGYYEGTSMACPAVSGVVALALSYAKQMRRHLTADELLTLMRDTSRPLDPYFTGTKAYHYYHTMPGTTARTMNLTDWRGKMGYLPDAAALLRAIADSGTPMKVPNIVVAKDKERTIRLSDYFAGGEQMTFSVTIADTSIATATVSGTSLTASGTSLTASGTSLTIHGIATGTTTATITAPGITPVTITITVRPTDSPYGWL